MFQADPNHNQATTTDKATYMEEFRDFLTDALRDLATPFMVIGAAILGRLMDHANRVKRGERKFWTWLLALDMIIAVGMGVIAYGLCQHVAIEGAPMAGLVALAGYLGPYGIDAIFNARIAQGRGGLNQDGSSKSPPANPTDTHN